MLSKLFPITVCIFAISLVASSQTTKVELSGSVTDAAGAVIPGAKVIIKPVSREESSAVVRAVNTDYDGRFVFSELAPGRYESRVKAAWFACEFTKIIELSNDGRAKLDLSIALDACADEVGPTNSEKLSDADRAEIARVLISRLISGRHTSSSVEKKILFIPENLSPGWLTQEQQARVSILKRTEIQEITERSGELTYYSLTKPNQRGSCVAVSVRTHFTVKGKLEDANMAGGVDVYEFRKIDGNWVPLLLYSLIF